MDIQFLLDEHLRGQLWRAVEVHNQQSQYSIDAVCIGDFPGIPLGSTDPDILLWCERERRILVSGDRKSLLHHFAAHLSAGDHSPGVFLLRPISSLPRIVEFLAAVAHASEASEWTDIWRYIP